MGWKPTKQFNWWPPDHRISEPSGVYIGPESCGNFEVGSQPKQLTNYSTMESHLPNLQMLGLPNLSFQENHICWMCHGAPWTSSTVMGNVCNVTWAPYHFQQKQVARSPIALWCGGGTKMDLQPSMIFATWFACFVFETWLLLLLVSVFRMYMMSTVSSWGWRLVKTAQPHGSRILNIGNFHPPSSQNEKGRLVISFEKNAISDYRSVAWPQVMLAWGSLGSCFWLHAAASLGQFQPISRRGSLRQTCPGCAT